MTIWNTDISKDPDNDKVGIHNYQQKTTIWNVEVYYYPDNEINITIKIFTFLNNDTLVWPCKDKVVKKKCKILIFCVTLTMIFF